MWRGDGGLQPARPQVRQRDLGKGELELYDPEGTDRDDFDDEELDLEDEDDEDLDDDEDDLFEEDLDEESDEF